MQSHSKFKKISRVFSILTLYIFITIITLFSFLPINTSVAHAQTAPIQYTPLSPLPGTVDNSGKADITTYLPGLFQIIIGLAAVIAVGRIIWGGILYITSDSWQNKNDGRQMINKAILGLLFIVGSWVIFYTINPNLFANNALNINLSIGSDTITGGLPVTAQVNPCGGADPTACQAEQIAETTLDNQVPPIGINTVCTVTNCPTQIANITPQTLAGLEALNTSCKNCNLVVTGGDEAGYHSTGGGHTQGTSLDLAVTPQLNAYFGVANPVPGTTYPVTINGVQTTALYETIGTTVNTTGTHWHVAFPQ